MNLSDIVKSHKAHSETINKAAKALRNLMLECGINTLKVNGCTIRVREVKANSGCCHDQLELLADDEYSQDWVCLQDLPSATNDFYYEYGDFSCITVKPTREQLLTFNSNTQAFLNKIADCLSNKSQPKHINDED